MQRIRKALRNEKGLTLVELLAVIVILGIIAAIAIPAVGGIISNTKEDSIKADAIQVLESAKLIYASGDVDDTTSELKWDQLEEYVEFGGDNPFKITPGSTDELKVTFVDGVPQISGKATKDDVSITFENDTIKDINDME